MALSVWTEAVPSGTSAVGQFPTYGRLTFAGISGAMAVEHYWNGTGGGSDDSAGDLRPGGSRAFFDVQSNSSAPNSQMTGRLFLASDTTRLLVYDSTGTYLAGTPFCDFQGSAATSNYWLKQSGSYSVSSATASGSTLVVFPTPYQSAPQVWTSPSEYVMLVACSSTSTNFTSAWSIFASTSDTTTTVTWEALGLASSGSY